MRPEVPPEASRWPSPGNGIPRTQPDAICLARYVTFDRWQLAIIAAGSTWGTGTIIVRYLQQHGLGPLTIAFFRSLGAWILMLTLMLSRQRSALRVSKRDIPALLVMAVAGPAMSQPLFIYCVTLTSVAVATILNYTSPVFAALIARVVYKELFTPKKILALILTFVGLGLVTEVRQVFLAGEVGVTTVSLAMGLGSGLCYAVYTVALKSVAARYHPLTIQVWNTGIGLPILFVYAVLGSCGAYGDLGPRTWGLAALNSLGPGFLAFLLFTWGMNGVPASHAPLLASVEPVTASLLGLLVLKERLTGPQYLGIALMLAGIAAISGPSSKQRPPPRQLPTR